MLLEHGYNLRSLYYMKSFGHRRTTMFSLICMSYIYIYKIQFMYMHAVWKHKGDEEKGALQWERKWRKAKRGWANEFSQSPIKENRKHARMKHWLFCFINSENKDVMMVLLCSPFLNECACPRGSQWLFMRMRLTSLDTVIIPCVFLNFISELISVEVEMDMLILSNSCVNGTFPWCKYF